MISLVLKDPEKIIKGMKMFTWYIIGCPTKINNNCAGKKEISESIVDCMVTIIYWLHILFRHEDNISCFDITRDSSHSNLRGLMHL